MKKLEIFDHSMIAGYRLCPARFNFRYIEHLEPINEAKYIPAFGSAGHESLDVRYRGGSYEEQINAFVNYWMPFEGQDIVKKNRTLERGIIMMEEYDRRYPLDKEPFKVYKDYVEMGFAVELDKYLICGKMDAVVEWGFGFSGLVVLEHKFSGSRGYLITEPNHQLDTYIWAARQLLGEPVVGALLNQIYHTRKTKKDGYYNDFEREFTERSDDVAIELWKKDTIDWIEAINRSIESGHWRRNPSSCSAFFKKCPYIQLCKPSMRQNIDKMMDKLFIIKKWEPFKDARTGNEG